MSNDETPVKNLPGALRATRKQGERMAAGCGSRSKSRPTGVPTSPVTRERISARSIDSANPCGQPRRRSNVIARSRAVHYHGSNRLCSWVRPVRRCGYACVKPVRAAGSPGCLGAVEGVVLTKSHTFPPRRRQRIIVQRIDRKDRFDALNSPELEADVHV